MNLYMGQTDVDVDDLMLMGMEYFMDELIDTKAKVRNTQSAGTE